MQTFNKEILFNYKPSVEVLKKTIEITEKLGNLSLMLSKTFKEAKKASRIFAYIESKYSSKIEGIYTTLFDVVNTGIETKQQNQIKPLVDELFKPGELLLVDRTKELALIMNTGVDLRKRYDSSFGIYKTENNERIKIYQPPLDESEIDNLLEKVIEKSKNDKFYYEYLHTHIMFEKIHPFVDGNGRIGRLLLQKQTSRSMNFSKVIPLSWAFFKNLSLYYSSFDINSTSDIDNAILQLLDILGKMSKVTEQFTSEVGIWVDSNIHFVKSQSNKITDEMALDILLSLQTKRIDVENKYGLNPRTIDSIFDKINTEIPFNFKKANRNNLYWNIELEQIIENHFNG